MIFFRLKNKYLLYTQINKQKNTSVYNIKSHLFSNTNDNHLSLVYRGTISIIERFYIYTCIFRELN
jgi:hypothetical protein